MMIAIQLKHQVLNKALFPSLKHLVARINPFFLHKHLVARMKLCIKTGLRHHYRKKW